MSKPEFSIIIPTYNRAHLLEDAVRSVLGQSVTDFELVISNGGSTDNTRDVVASFSDHRIRYIEASERLSIGDNYQLGLSNARGEFITFLSDDDAYTPVLLERAKQVFENENAEIVGYLSARYYHDEIFDQQLYISENSLLIPSFDRSVTRFEAADAADQVLALHRIGGGEPHPKFICPYLANNVYHRSIFKKLQDVKSGLFHSVPADLYLAMAVFLVGKSYHCLDEPLHVWSNWAGNASAAPERKLNTLRTHYENLLNGKQLEFTPLKFAMPHNCATNAIIEALTDFGGSESKQRLNWRSYYKVVFEELTSLNRRGVDVSRELFEFDEVLRMEEPTLRKAVELSIRSWSFRVQEVSRRFPWLTRFAKNFLMMNKSTPPTLVLGKHAGFSGVLQSSAYLSSRVMEAKKGFVN